MSNFHTAVYLTKEQKEFLDRNCVSATKLMQNYVQRLIEKNEKLEFSRPEQLIKQINHEEDLYAT